MAGNNTAVFGIYPNSAAVDSAVSALKGAGLPQHGHLRPLPRERRHQGLRAREGHEGPRGRVDRRRHRHGGRRYAGLAGRHWRPGHSGRRSVHRGRSDCRRHWRALAWAARSAASVGALVGMGIPEYEAKRYEGRIIKGGILLSVHSDNSEWTSKAKTILEETGAEDIASAGESRVTSRTPTGRCCAAAPI